MRSIAIGAVLAGAGVVTARALAPKLHERVAAACERMLDQMPENFPPKRAMGSIEQVRADTARILESLGEREEAADGPHGVARSSQPIGHAA